ncbi:MAG: class I SAM-dependent methyltransferase, partial [Bacteroidota bacterium]
KPYDDDFARLYDLFVYARNEVEADAEEVDFLAWAFRDLSGRGVKDVLDVGCGTGRNLIPLVRNGFTVTGLDNSRGMLKETSRRLRKHGLSADLVEQDMEKLTYTQQFDALLCMSSGIDYLLTADRMDATLTLFRNALRPGGMLVLDSWNFLAQWQRLDKPYSDVRTSDGVRIEYSDRQWYDNFTSIYHMEMGGIVHEGDKTYNIQTHHALRAMTVGERRRCLRAAGFVNVSVHPGFTSRLEDSPPNAERIICVGIRLEKNGS